MGSDRLDRGEDRLHGGNAARMGAPGGARSGSAGWTERRGAGPHQGPGMRGARTAPGQRDPAQGVGVFCDGGARPPVQAMIAFIDDHREAHGVELICRVLPIAPSTYHAHAAKRADPGKLSARARRDADLQSEIKRVWNANFQVYGVRKVWRQLQREAIAAPRCQVARLMKRMGRAGAVRGKTVKTTHSDKSTQCPLDRVNRQFRAPGPNVLWVSDFTYVATWQGFVYVAFVIDAFARHIVGWRVSRSARADFVLDALVNAGGKMHRLGGVRMHQ